MSSHDFKTSTPPAGTLTKIVARLIAGWRARAAANAMAGMGERERQDIGWGQMDRYTRASSLENWRNSI